MADEIHSLEDLKDAVGGGDDAAVDMGPRAPQEPVRDERSERAIIREALDRNHGNRQATARELGMHRATLWRKIRQYDL